jgi:4-hydroxy-tetrahydrodipicolinate synthase
LDDLNLLNLLNLLTTFEVTMPDSIPSGVWPTMIKLFNANAATLLDSLELGLAGYSGVMANFHPELYVWLWRNWADLPGAARQLQNFLGAASLIERQVYPVNAKYYLQLAGLPLGLHTRVRDSRELSSSARLEVAQLRALSHFIASSIDNRCFRD